MLLLFFQSVVRLLGIRAEVRHAALASAEVEAWPTSTAAVVDSALLSMALSATTRASAALGSSSRHSVTLSTAIV